MTLAEVYDPPANSATFAVGLILYAATMYRSGSSLFGITGLVPVAGQTLVFIPVGLLGVEMARRSMKLSATLGWSALTAFAIVQMFAAWPSNGLLYGCMYVGGWMTYRLFLAKAGEVSTFRQRLRSTLISGMAIAAIAVTLGAASILPVLDFSGQSNVPGGDYSNVIGGNYASGGQPYASIFYAYLTANFISAASQGGALIVLALVAVIFGRLMYGIPFFTFMILLFSDLTAIDPILADVLHYIPMFDHIHGHRATAAMWMVTVSFSMLAGAAFQALTAHRRRKEVSFLMVVPLCLLLLATLAIQSQGYTIQLRSIAVAVVASLVIMPLVLALPKTWKHWEPRVPAIVAAALLASIFAYPTGTELLQTIKNPTYFYMWGDLLGKDQARSEFVETAFARQDPGSAASLLRRQTAVLQPFRYAPFTGSAGPDFVFGNSAARAMDPNILGILANGRAQRLGLEQIPGYNPMHLKYYVDYVDVMNGSRQDYHYLDVMPPAVTGSQLLDMLNVRYIIVPRNVDYLIPTIFELAAIVYQNDLVTVFENPNAFPRAWIVHDVQPAQDGAELQLLHTGQVDGRTTAFVHGDLPPISPTDPNGPADSVIVTSYEPETIELSARSTGDGLLVLSEVYANGWNAYVDGERVEVQRTNHALRGVPLAAGDHEVVLRYEPLSLRIGLWSTGLSSIAMIGVWIWAGIDWRRRRRTSGDH